MSKYELLKKKIEECKQTNIEDIDPAEIDEIKAVTIDTDVSSTDRIVNFINKVKNPYIFKVNGKLVRIRFSDTDKTAEDCLTNVLNNFYR